jgi:hypothetical protein
VARKNPLGKLVGTAVDAVKHPLGTAEKVVGTAKGTASLGKLAAEQVTKAAASTALDTVGSVAQRARLTRGKPTPAPAETPSSPADLRPVPSVNEPAHPPVEEAARSVASTTAKKAPAKKADGGAPAKKAPGKKAPAAKKAAKKVAPPAPPAKEVPARRAAEPVTGTQEQALQESPDEAARKAAARGAAAKAAPGKKAPAAKKVTTKKTAKKAPAKKTPAKKVPADQALAEQEAENQAPAPGTEAETVWSTSTPGDRLPAGEGKRNEADPEVPVSEEDREAAHEATPADVAKAADED